MVKRVWVHGDDLWPNNRTARHAEYIAASDYDALAARLAEAEALLKQMAAWRVAIECVAPELGGASMTLARIDAFLAAVSASETQK